MSIEHVWDVVGQSMAEHPLPTYCCEPAHLFSCNGSGRTSPKDSQEQHALHASALHQMPCTKLCCSWDIWKEGWGHFTVYLFCWCLKMCECSLNLTDLNLSYSKLLMYFVLCIIYQCSVQVALSLWLVKQLYIYQFLNVYTSSEKYTRFGKWCVYMYTSKSAGKGHILTKHALWNIRQLYLSN